MDRVPYASAVGSLMYDMVCTRPDLAHAVSVVSRGAVSWKSRLQKCMALSTTEAEYMAPTKACKELLWLKRFLQELGFKQQRYAILCDNQSVIHLAKNLMFHKRTKHINVRYHWIRDAIEDGMYELNKVHTDDNASDNLTKAVAREKLKGIINQLTSMGIKFKDEIQGLWLLGTLPDTWETFRTSLSNSAPDGVITMELAKGNMRLNIISTSLLDKDGYHNSSGNDNDDMTELWHKRLGQMSEKGMSILSNKNVLFGVHDINLKKCSHCLAGKQTRLAFKSRSPFRMENILDLVHFDVCGPMKTKRLGECSYFVTFIDDHSRKVWVYTLKTKDQVLDVFKQFHALVERQTWKKLKCIRTNNGGEYIGPFDAYCREHGIQHQKTPSKTPQLNGLAERMNRTLVERVRCLLSHAELPASFWGEALNTVAFVHIPKDERSKLDVKTKPSVFLGYGQDEFGYRLYDPVQKKLVRSRDVVFEEDQTLKDVENAERETIPYHNDDLIDLDPVPPKHFDSQFGDDIQNDEEHGVDDDDAQEQLNLDEDVHLELPVPDMPPFLLLKRSTRGHHPSTRYFAYEYVSLTDGGEPKCYAEAMEDELKKGWFEAMQDEMSSLHENDTFELVKLPKGKRALKNKWVFKLKTEEHTSRLRYKARLVVKGFSQKRGIDFDEIFSLVVKIGSIRVVLGLVASLDLEVKQMDVKTAFLHGDLDKEIYMEQPEVFQVKGKEDYVCRL
nr:retrovirus-related Pol polyprotein from transposon TNT 1-94 [Tanacetum cinerariifolium]